MVWFVYIFDRTRVGFEGFEGQGLRARLHCRRYLTPYFGYIIDCPAQCLAQRKSQKKYTKRKYRNRLETKTFLPYFPLFTG